MWCVSQRTGEQPELIKVPLKSVLPLSVIWSRMRYGLPVRVRRSLDEDNQMTVSGHLVAF